MTKYSPKSPQKRIRSGVFLNCATCGDEFYIPPSRAKLGAAKYCSKKCYVKTGENNPMYGRKLSEGSVKKMMEHPNRHSFKADETNPNFSRYGKDFDPKTPWLLRKRLLERRGGTCEECGFSEESGILEMHHKDRDRKNNAMDNVILLCPNCHCLEHYRAGDGKYHRKPNRASFKKK